MNPFKGVYGAPAAVEPRPRRPDDPEDSEPVAPGDRSLCYGCWLYEERHKNALETPCSKRPELAGALYKCRAELRPDGQKVIFIKRTSYGNEED